MTAFSDARLVEQGFDGGNQLLRGLCAGSEEAWETIEVPLGNGSRVQLSAQENVGQTAFTDARGADDDDAGTGKSVFIGHFNFVPVAASVAIVALFVVSVGRTQGEE